MPELDGVGEEEHFGGAIDNMEAAEVMEGRADVESMAAAGVPELTGAWFVVDGDATAGRPNEGGVVVERAIEVVPGGNVGSKGGLEEEVESEFGLRGVWRYLGKAVLMPARVDRKWAFKVWMDRLAELRKWTSGGTSWYSTFQSSSIMRK